MKQHTDVSAEMFQGPGREPGMKGSEKEFFAAVDQELGQLTCEYGDWLKANGLDDLGSADEHLFDARLSAEQRAWIKDFCDRWEGASPRISGGKWKRGRE